MGDQEHDREHSEMLNSDYVDQLSVSDDSEPEEPPIRELDHNEDDDSVPAAFHTARSSFSLSGGSSAFSDRSHSIFDCLDSVDQQTSSSLSQESTTDRLFTQPPFPSRKTSHLSSNCPIPPKKRGVPDYLVHPEKWTRYSLEDVTETSDQDNRKVAHQFLSSLQQERTRDSSCDSQQKMIFSRPKRQAEEQPADHLSTVRVKERRMHLSHLEEEDEDEEGRQKEKMRRRTEKSVEKTEEKGKDEETDTSGAVAWTEDSKQVEREKKIEESTQGFTYFRNTKAKNYRKSSGCEDP
ncbi:U5 small nuclear ribonucleoprotein TSSC4 [Stegastes partitus]|uniref:U5 small nuclear ribonucleoprotein TSSC4 n=1 Tax=Stegastes partitus TaxID=144197 RepID=A0A9Y4NG33_9TELE|nr:PREDICTED: protein TSSC4 [Stegastes partitus]XP_008296653.1 PREDICTED: protein TSSC4 [Stegastes partitus]